MLPFWASRGRGDSPDRSQFGISCEKIVEAAMSDSIQASRALHFVK
jgi:hypothetical protein